MAVCGSEGESDFVDVMFSKDTGSLSTNKVLGGLEDRYIS